MAGSTRFEMGPSNSEGSGFPATHPNGQRGNYPNATLDRSGSFREGQESKLLGAGLGSSRGSAPSSGEAPHLSQFLSLDLITMTDQKFTRSGELRRVLGVSLGSTSEDHFGAAHSKAPPIASEELKRFKGSVLDTSIKARDRVKRITDSIVKLDKFRLISRKRRTETSERSVGGGMLKMGSQIHQNRPDVVTQKAEERTRSILNKRVRTSVAEPEGRATAQLRQSAAVDKEREMFRAVNGGPTQGEENIRALSAGVEGWDKKMKRKRSVGALAARVMDGDRDLKRARFQKPSNAPRSRSSDSHSFGSGSSNGIVAANKLDCTTLPTTANPHPLSKSELENFPLPNERRERTTGAGVDKERAAKGNKFSVREESQVSSSSPVTKGKPSRVPHTGSAGIRASPNFLRGPGAIDGWEQPQALSKAQTLTGPNNRKRPLPTGSSSPTDQWGGQGQRPQKNSRTRRANLASPVTDSEEAEMSSEGFPVVDVGVRVTSNEVNGSLVPRRVPNNTQQLKMKLENVPSPARLSVSEESGAGENKLKEKQIDNDEIEDKGVNVLPKVGSLLPPVKKNKIPSEEVGDGVRRQGRSGRPSLSRAGIPPVREKLGNSLMTKPHQSTRHCSDKTESKLGRPPKKLSDRKASTRLLVPNGVTSYFTGASDDDRGELLAAAATVFTSRNIACSGPFWKKMESIFASVSSDNAAYLKQQVLLLEEIEDSLCADTNYNILARDELVHDGFQGVDTLHEKLPTKRKSEMVNPLYQTLLSALIVEDEMEEFELDSERKYSPFLYASDGSPCGTSWDRVEYEIESEMELRPQNPCLLDNFSSDVSTACNGFRSPSSRIASYNDEMSQGSDGLVHLDSEAISRNGQSNLDASQPIHTNGNRISSPECQYEKMSLDSKVLLELQSIGLYPDTMPDLDEGEGYVGKDIVELRTSLYQQVGKKKWQLHQLDKAIQKEKEVEGRDLEREAMNKLVEMAYKKQMASRGSSASKNGVHKVSKQAALAFIKRTIGRCRKLEDTGRSCFSDPALQNVIISGLSDRNYARSVDNVGDVPTYAQAPASQQGSTISGVIPIPIGRKDSGGDKLDAFAYPTQSSDRAFPKHEPVSNRGRKREVLLDEVTGSAASRCTSLVGNNLLGGAKGRRSDRDRDQNKNTVARNSVPRSGRPGERKTKAKPKQKTAQLSTSGNGLLGRATETMYPSMLATNEAVTTGSSKMSREHGLLSHGNVPQDSSKETEEPLDFSNLPLHEIASIDDLGVSNNLDAPQDLSSWLNFDEDGLQDHDSMGLEIPMDDLSDLNMMI